MMKRFVMFLGLALFSIVPVMAAGVSPEVSQMNLELATQVCTRAPEPDVPNVRKDYRSTEACIKDQKINFDKQGDYTGKWAMDRKMCSKFEPYGEGFALVTKDKLVYTETSCKIKRVKSGAHGRALMFNVTATCESEGEVSPAKYVFNADSAGILTIEDPFGEQTYYRCN